MNIKSLIDYRLISQVTLNDIVNNSNLTFDQITDIELGKNNIMELKEYANIINLVKYNRSQAQSQEIIENIIEENQTIEEFVNDLKTSTDTTSNLPVSNRKRRKV